MNYAPTFRRGLPLRVDPTAAAEAGAASLVRAIAASMIAARRHPEPADRIARSLWPDDGAATLFLKSASGPAAIATPSWAGILSHSGQVANVISLLAPGSVAGALLSRCMHLTWPPGTQQVMVPTLTANTPAAAWVGEGKPAPVFDFISSSVPLTPRKISAVCIFSRELANYSTPDIEQLLRTALSESLGQMLDITLLGSGAGDAATPSGVFNNIVPLVASVQSIMSEAMSEDISRLIASVATVAGNNPIALVMSPRQAASMRVRTDIDYETFSSSALADGTVAALATNALASIGDAVPEFSASTEASFHEETLPADLVGAGGAVAAPVRGLFQTDCLALRLRCSLNFALRSPKGAALITGVAW